MGNAVSSRDVKARCCSVVVRKHGGTFGYIGLPGGAIGHLKPALLEAYSDLLENRIVEPQRATGQFRNDFPGNIVRGRTESAGDQNDVASGCGFGDRIADRLAIRDGQLPLYAHSQREELLGQKGEVRVDDAAKKKLRTGV